MLTIRNVNLIGYFVVFMMIVIFLLVLFKQVPQTWYWTMFLIALTLFLIRVALRLALARQERLTREKAHGQIPASTNIPPPAAP